MNNKNLDLLNEKLSKVIEILNQEFAMLHSLGAHPDLLLKVKVDYYGDLISLNKIANIYAQDATQLIVAPYDVSALKTIIDGINKADLGLNPVLENNFIRIYVSPINFEKRQQFAKTAKNLGEQIRIQIRNNRQEILKKVHADNSISKNEVEMIEKEIQLLIDKYNKIVDQKVKDKQEQLLKI